MDQRTIRFGEDTLERVEALARRAGISVSEYVRRATEAQVRADEAAERSVEMEREVVELRGRVARLERLSGQPGRR